MMAPISILKTSGMKIDSTGSAKGGSRATPTAVTRITPAARYAAKASLSDGPTR